MKNAKKANLMLFYSFQGIFAQQKRSWIVIFLLIFSLNLFTSTGQSDEVLVDYLNKRDQIVEEMLDGLEAELFSKNLATEDDVVAIWPLTVDDCTRITLESNINIKISYLDFDNADRNVTIAEANFDPTFSVGAGITRTRTPAKGGGLSSATESITHDMALTQKLSTGGSYTIDLDHDRSSRTAHTFTSDLGLTFTQPILKDAGPDVTLSTIHISQNNYDIATEDLRQDIISLIENTHIAYWDILDSQESLRARNIAYRQAVDLISQNEREMALGKRTYTDVLQAQATAASREDAVLTAKNTLEEREDTLKRFLGVEDPIKWRSKIVIADKIDPNFQPISVDIETCLLEALTYRTDYQKALTTLKNNEIRLMLEKNDLLPDVTANLGYSFNGKGPSSRNSFESLRTGEFPDWNASFSLSFPWGKRADKANYSKSLNDFREQELVIKNLEMKIVKEVRQTIRGVKTNIKRVRTSELAYTLQEKKLEAEQKKFDLGLSTSFEVLEFQEDLQDASLSRISAIVDYHQSVIRLWSTLGTTLRRNNIRLEDTLR